MINDTEAPVAACCRSSPTALDTTSTRMQASARGWSLNRGAEDLRSAIEITRDYTISTVATNDAEASLGSTDWTGSLPVSAYLALTACRSHFDGQPHSAGTRSGSRFLATSLEGNEYLLRPYSRRTRTSMQALRQRGDGAEQASFLALECLYGYKDQPSHA
jgi:hypothetical protein